MSTYIVSKWVGHTFFKLVNFECVGVLVCCSVGMCWCVGVLVPLVPWMPWRLEECKIGRVKEWKSLRLEECRIERV